MLKFLSLTGVLTVAFSGGAIASLTQIAAGDTSLSPSGGSTLDDPFFCYMQTGDGRVMDLTRICATNPTSRNSTQNQGATPNVTVSSSNQDVVNLENGLGANGCYVFDANGRPCSPIQ
jgi:hypothetical protein